MGNGATIGSRSVTARSAVAVLCLRAALAAVPGLLPAALLAAPECQADRVWLRGAWGSAYFTVEVADTPQGRSRGLMHREALPRRAGMLFIYDQAQPVSFWMKNTLIPLDMIFADATGTVRRVHHMARPHDETAIPGGGPVKAVLEINGGLARDMGIGPGTQLRHPAFATAVAAWPC